MKFVYLGGTDSDGSELPAAVHMFGLRFAVGEAVDVRDAHARAKLEGNRFFKPFADDAEFVELPPPPKKPKPPKAVAVEVVA